MLFRTRFSIIVLWTIIATLVLANNAMAYVGPGAGMEFITYAIGLLAMVGMAFFSILTWPFFAFVRWLRGNKPAVATGATTDPALSADPSQPSSSKASTDSHPNQPPAPSVP
jgi:hypothetical protein